MSPAHELATLLLGHVAAATNAIGAGPELERTAVLAERAATALSDYHARLRERLEAASAASS